MNTNWIKNLQGKIHYEYSDPRGLTLTEKYMECYPYLRVFDEVSRVEKLEFKYNTLEKFVRELLANKQTQ